MRTLWALSQFVSDPVTGQLVPVAADYANAYMAPANPLPIVSVPTISSTVAGVYSTPAPLAASATGQSTTIFGGSNGWTNPSNITLPTGPAATYSFGTSPGIVNCSFGAGVPLGAVVTGISISYDRKINSGTVTTAAVGLSIAGNNGTPKGPSSSWTTGFVTETWGGSSDLWGFGTISPADLQSGLPYPGTGPFAPFFFLNVAKTSGAGVIATVQNLSVTIYYNLTAGASITASAGDNLIATVGWSYPTGATLVLPTVVDDRGNTWTALDSAGGPTDSGASGQYQVALYYANNVAAGVTNLTATPDVTATALSVGVARFSNTLGSLQSHGTGGSSVTTTSNQSLVVTASFGTASANACANLTVTGGLTGVTAHLPGGGSGTSVSCATKFAYGVIASVSNVNIAMTGGTAQHQVYAVFNPFIASGLWGLVQIQSDPPQIAASLLDARIIYAGTVWDTPPSTVMSVYAAYLLGTETLMGQVLNELGDNLDARFSPQ
jgi:hypothetical protein